MKNPKITHIFSPIKSYSVTASFGEEEYSLKNSKRNSNNLPLSAYNASTWCHLFSNLYKKIYEKPYENYKKIDAESILISNSIYPYAFDELKYSAREFARFLATYLQTSHNAKRELVIFMLSKPASLSKMEYYIKKYRRLREKDLLESLVYMPHIPMTNDPDDLKLILQQSNLTPIQMLSNYGIGIFHRYLQIQAPMSYEDATHKTHEIMLKEILIKYKNNTELIKKLFEIITKNSILWEPFFEEGHNKGIKTSSYYTLDWRKEYSDFWKEFSFYKENWWKSEEQTSQLKPIVTVKKFFKIVQN